jgi:hypothetical protein
MVKLVLEDARLKATQTHPLLGAAYILVGDLDGRRSLQPRLVSSARQGQRLFAAACKKALMR